MKAVISFIAIVAVLGSCSTGRNALSPEEYVAWYRSESYPYRDTVVKNGVVYVLEGIPAGLDLSRQFRAGKITAGELKTASEEDKDAGLSFELTIILPHSGTDIYSFASGNTSENIDRHHYFAFDMKNDLRAVGKTGDSLACGFFLQERLIGNFPKARFSFDFGRNIPKEVVFNDRIFSGQPVLFTLSNHQPLPGLKTRSIQ